MEKAQEKRYTRREVTENKDLDKVLVILHDNVYNVHPFLNEHPGGEEILLDHKGTDGSEDFDDVGHSHDAIDLMKKYQVGRLVDSERRNKQPKKGWVAKYNSKEPEKYVQGPGMPFYLLVGGIVFAVAFFFYQF
ncbi:cytochrome b5 [Harpegnathos saltator]|uniref:Cytochrome b5 n=1 Tax=Harpegnathos saltator TaxID=610380 RepID=E2BM06_HARSA|nr:cytochrome b5 [Harpegnathos saltator]XP_025161063.1 cytochrome b5 [Harpegnathos saltator]EFN83255.1 Cytochrome b5 [Harpegnathos saltator]